MRGANRYDSSWRGSCPHLPPGTPGATFQPGCPPSPSGGTAPRRDSPHINGSSAGERRRAGRHAAGLADRPALTAGQGRGRARAASRKQKKRDPRTLIAAGAMVLVTSLPKEIPVAAICAAYRLRWQIEPGFKRLKTLPRIDRIPTRTTEGGLSWLYPHLILALMTEDIIPGSLRNPGILLISRPPPHQPWARIPGFLRNPGITRISWNLPPEDLVEETRCSLWRVTKIAVGALADGLARLTVTAMLMADPAARGLIADPRRLRKRQKFWPPRLNLMPMGWRPPGRARGNAPLFAGTNRPRPRCPRTTNTGDIHGRCNGNQCDQHQKRVGG